MRNSTEFKVKGLCGGLAQLGVASDITSCGATPSSPSGGTKQETDSAQTGQDLPTKILYTQKATDRYHSRERGQAQCSQLAGSLG